jgi:hypothetical protein
MDIKKLSQKDGIAKKHIALRAQLWPKVHAEDLWTRKTKKGFTTVPRTLPIILEIMDNLSKGKRISSAYLDLWCRTYDECIVTLNNHQKFAFHAGFSGERAVQTWSNRIEIIERLGFISTAPGSHGPKSYVLILNPYRVVKRHFEKRTPGLSIALYNELIARAIEIGADDLV